ncbi:hypothetical protein HY02_06895 [Peptococcaceae bacterium SCADC1_2_3]|jgi:urease accessory protein|nr:hypothetical protein DK28_0212950 [Peptococcaceae bacterium SCADC1_2_3]KFI37439.1 hypothetical protein HY02_06895 [Peptococcaceae bacterium SCADC1_2_3]
MIINQIIGNINDFPLSNRIVEKIYLTWEEIEKRMIRKTTDQGTEVGLVLSEPGNLRNGDVVYADAKRVIIIEVKALDAIVIKPKSFSEVGRLCYVLGNRHLPIFIEDDEVIIPYDNITWIFLQQIGFKMERKERKASRVCQSSRHH